MYVVEVVRKICQEHNLNYVVVEAENIANVLERDDVTSSKAKIVPVNVRALTYIYLAHIAMCLGVGKVNKLVRETLSKSERGLFKYYVKVCYERLKEVKYVDVDKVLTNCTKNVKDFAIKLGLDENNLLNELKRRIHEKKLDKLISKFPLITIGILYNMCIEKGFKTVTVSELARKFMVDKDTAKEWVKI